MQAVHALNSVADFTSKAVISASVMQVDRNPDEPWQGSDKNHWRIELQHRDRSMVLWMSMDRSMVERNVNGKWVRQFTRDEPQTDLQRMLWRNRYREARPTAEEVLKLVRRNAARATKAINFGGWLAGCGYENDPRANREVYRACLRQADELYLMLGSNLYRELLELDA
jgi:hypothetical protein